MIYKEYIVKYMPLILLIGFIAGLYALWFSVYQIVRPLRQENIILKKAIKDFENSETEIIRGGENI